MNTVDAALLIWAVIATFMALFFFAMSLAYRRQAYKALDIATKANETATVMMDLYRLVKPQ